MHFHEARIYSVESTDNVASAWGSELNVRNDIIIPSRDFVSHVVDEASHPDKYQLEIENLNDNDLLLFTNITTRMAGYVVTEPGVAIDGDIVESSPGKYASRSLMEKIEAIGPDELIQFNLIALARYAYKNLSSRNSHFDIRE